MKRKIYTSIAILLTANSSFAFDIYHTQKIAQPNIQSAATVADTSQKKCTDKGRTIECSVSAVKGSNNATIQRSTSSDVSDFMSNSVVRPSLTVRANNSGVPPVSGTPTNSSGVPGGMLATKQCTGTEPLSENFVAEHRCIMDANYQAILRREPRNPFRSLAPDPRWAIDCRDRSGENATAIARHGEAWWTQLCGTFSPDALKEMLDRRASNNPRLDKVSNQMVDCKKPLKSDFRGNLSDTCDDFPKWGMYIRALNSVGTTSSDWIDLNNEKLFYGQAYVGCSDISGAQSRTANMVGNCVSWGSGFKGVSGSIVWGISLGARGLPAGTSQDIIDFNNRMITTGPLDQRCTNFDLAMNNCNFKTRLRVISYDSTKEDYLKNWDSMVDAAADKFKK